MLGRVGYLDAVDTSQISLVDRVVFDKSASPAIRTEALSFMMEHTTGFDFLLKLDKGNQASSGRSSKKQSSLAGPSKLDNSLEDHADVLCAIETVVEFFEDVCHNDSDGGTQELTSDVLYPMAEMLVDAFDGLPRMSSGSAIVSLT